MKSEENFPFWVRVPSTSEAIKRIFDKAGQPHKKVNKIRRQ
jgi:hypothetical protein